MNGKREKNALVLFAALALFGIACIAAYVYFGHNWNFAVSRFDDTFGDMESYTVLLYEGTIDPEAEDPSHPESGTFVLSLSTPSEDEAEAEKKAVAAAATGSSEESDAVGEQSLEKGEDASSQPTLTQRIRRKIETFFNMDTDSVASDQEAEQVKEDPVISDEIEGTSIDEVAESYESKNAIPFILNTSDPLFYEEGVVMERSGKRIAVLGVHSMVSVASIQSKVDWMRALNASMVVAIVDEVPRIAGVQGIDVVVRASTTIPKSWDFAVPGRYVTIAPVEGSVAATIISPSNIVTSKIL